MRCRYSRCGPILLVKIFLLYWLKLKLSMEMLYQTTAQNMHYSLLLVGNESNWFAMIAAKIYQHRHKTVAVTIATCNAKSLPLISYTSFGHTDTDTHAQGVSFEFYWSILALASMHMKILFFLIARYVRLYVCIDGSTNIVHFKSHCISFVRVFKRSQVLFQSNLNKCDKKLCITKERNEERRGGSQMAFPIHLLSLICRKKPIHA